MRLWATAMVCLGIAGIQGCGGAGSSGSGSTSTGGSGATTTATVVSLTSSSPSSGTEKLTFPTLVTGLYGVQVDAITANGTTSAYSDRPAAIYTCQTQTAGVCGGLGTTAGTGFATQSNTQVSGYTTVTQTSDSEVTAVATLQTVNLTIFRITDVYTAGASGNGFVLSRTVKLVGVGNGQDAGFNSQFQLALKSTPSSMDSYHVFAPAIWYDKNTNASSGGIGTDVLNHNYFYWRESRTSLPLVMLQEPATGTALSMAHTGANGTGGPVIGSQANENSQNWLVDSSVQYGSIGLAKAATGGTNPTPYLGFVYPADEGDITYIGGDQAAWIRRSTPVTATATQNYTLALHLDHYATATSTGSDNADYPTAMAQTWRTYYSSFAPAIADDHASTVMTDEIGLLNDVYKEAPAKVWAGFPFGITDVTAGTGVSTTFQMGYVGEQIPLGFQLLRWGALNGDTTSLNHGTTMLNFWANQDPLAQQSGLPLPWYAPSTPPASPWVNTNCNSPIFIRMTSDGMEGMVTAAAFARLNTQAGGPELNWEKFATSYADWLVKVQAADGSFSRAYNPDGSVWVQTASCVYTSNGGTNVINVDGASKLNTTFPVRFLVQMYFATGNAAYATAAKQAGAFAYTNIYLPTTYTGGITDRNALDRESGAQALHAALALYDLAYAQGDSAAQAQWLKAAQMAADYLETWQYAFTFTVNDPTGSNPQYAYAGPRASSLSVTGESTAGIYLAIAAFDYYRLHLLTNEGSTGHYGQFALLLANNTKLTTQLTGVSAQNFGWLYNGFTTEATNLAQFTLSTSSIGWLPWLTNAEIDSEQRLSDAFGSVSVAQLLQNETRAGVLQTYQSANHNLYPAAGSIGWGK